MNARDAEGLVALYEPDAVLAFPPGQITIGRNAIRTVYQQFVAGSLPVVAGAQQPAIRNGDLAITSTRLRNGVVTLEVARQQPNGSWLWAIDQPDLLGRLAPPK